MIDIKFKELSLVEASGKLISRKLVEHGVVNTFNSAHLRLLKDGAKSITAGVLSKHGGGAELAEIELFVTDILGSFIVPVIVRIELFVTSPLVGEVIVIAGLVLSKVMVTLVIALLPTESVALTDMNFGPRQIISLALRYRSEW